MREANPMEQDLQRAIDVLRKGGIILYPTDTVWGLGCDACNPEAVARLIALKGRKPDKGIIALVGSEEMAHRLTGVPVPQIGEEDRPTTVIYPRTSSLASAMLAKDGTAALRLTRETFSRELCLRLPGPVASTSANLSGEPTPAIFSEINPKLLEIVDYVAEYGRHLKPSSPSRIVKIEPDGTITTLRQ